MQKHQYPSNVITTALSALMFFAPFIENQLYTSREGYSQEEFEFIGSWIPVGKTMLYLVGIFFLLYIGAVGLKSSLLLELAYLDAALLLVMIGVSFLLILAEITWKPTLLSLSLQQRYALLKSFTPYLSTVRWLQQENYLKPNRRLKESQLWRVMILIFAVIAPVWYLACLGVILFFWRMISILRAKDYLPQDIKLLLHQQYYRYAEEVLLGRVVRMKKYKNPDLSDSSSRLSKRLILSVIMLLVLIWGTRSWYAQLWRKAAATLLLVIRWVLVLRHSPS